ncbi:MAG TPA: 3'-5' exonuclease, partial [Humisphaera sp.]|nr:3'-5' exonuclease [Humisphaera sp.]
GEPPMYVMDKDSKKEGLSPRQAGYGDIVILLRATKYKAGQFAQILRGQGIPVHADSGSGFFESTEVRDMLALLELLENRRQDIPLATALRSPLLALRGADDAMARIRAAYPATNTRSAFHEAALRYATEHSDNLAMQLRDFFAQLDRWRQASARRPLAEVIWQIYRETGYLAFVAGLVDGQQREANLLYLHQRAAQFASFGQHGVAGFLTFLRELEDASDLGPPSVVSQAEKVVRIMSVHRSKGQEFPIVIVADLGKLINHQDSSGPILADRRAMLGLSVVDEYRNCRYPSLALALAREQVRRQTMAEELRVLYVAMTRAREHLILVGTAAEKKPQEWVTQWSGREGAMPAEVILGARSMLDWLGPVAAATSGVLEIKPHSWDEVSAWGVAASQRQSFTAEQQRMARFEPLETEPPIPPAAAKVIRRVAFEYPFKFYSELPAAQSVTARTHASAAKHSTPDSDSLPRYSGGGLGRGPFAKDRHSVQPPPQPSPGVPGEGERDATGEGETSGPEEEESGIPGQGEKVAPAIRLSQPNFLLEERPLNAADKGTATHLVLEHFNFVGAGDLPDIEAQIQHLISRKMMTTAQAAAVDRAAIQWFLQTELGQLLRKHSAILIRELPLYFPEDVGAKSPLPSNDPLDRIMIRGRLDLLLPLDDGAILIDYKTDAIATQEVPTRGEFYRPQLQAYAEAFEKITSKRVSQILLVFLSPRVVHRLT